VQEKKAERKRQRKQGASMACDCWLCLLMACLLRTARRLSESTLQCPAGSHGEGPPVGPDSESASSGDEGIAGGSRAAADGGVGAAAPAGTSGSDPTAGGAAADGAAGREDWMTTPMGRSVTAAPAADAKPDKQQDVKDRAAIAAVGGPVSTPQVPPLTATPTGARLPTAVLHCL
jgi:hypothetical protein